MPGSPLVVWASVWGSRLVQARPLRLPMVASQADTALPSTSACTPHADLNDQASTPSDLLMLGMLSASNGAAVLDAC